MIIFFISHLQIKRDGLFFSAVERCKDKWRLVLEEKTSKTHLAGIDAALKSSHVNWCVCDQAIILQILFTCCGVLYLWRKTKVSIRVKYGSTVRFSNLCQLRWALIRRLGFCITPNKEATLVSSCRFCMAVKTNRFSWPRVRSGSFLGPLPHFVVFPTPILHPGGSPSISTFH